MRNYTQIALELGTGNRRESLPGKLSLPSPIPRSVRMTEMKWMQEFVRSGRLLELVRSLTSAVEIFPITFKALSTTAMLVSPSLLINWSASDKGLSPLHVVNECQTHPSCLLTLLILSALFQCPSLSRLQDRVDQLLESCCHCPTGI